MALDSTFHTSKVTAEAWAEQILLKHGGLLLVFDQDGNLHTEKYILPPVEIITQRQRFNELKQEWKNDIQLESSVQRIVLNGNYQKIIGMGKEAVPFIIEELQKEPDHWFWALTAITDEDPAEGETTLEGATEKWLEWAKKNGLIY